MSLKTTTKTANFVTNRMLNTIRDTLNTPAICSKMSVCVNVALFPLSFLFQRPRLEF